MKAQDIKNALSQTLALVPAITKAAEIVESAEMAERALVELGKTKQVLDETIAALKLKREEYEAMTVRARNDHQNVLATLEKEKADLNEQIRDTRAALTGAQKDLDKFKPGLDLMQASKELAEFKKQDVEERTKLANEIAERRKVLDGLKAEVEALKKKFA